MAHAAPRVPALANPVYYHFRKWRLDGRLRRAHDRLRSKAVREAEGREEPDPSAAVIDSRMVKTTPVAGPARGYDGGAKRLAGRKRHILLVDTNGLVLAARGSTERTPSRPGRREAVVGRSTATGAAPDGAGVGRDGAYTGGLRRWAEEERGWRVEVPHHRDRQLWRYGLEEKPRGFRVLPRRWVVERTFAWLGLSRRFSKDYERLPETAEAMIYGAMSRLMLRRLARAA